MSSGRRRIKFIKMSAGGNDFVLIDNRDKRLPKNLSGLARHLCKRKFSIGADGLLVLENAPAHNFKMIYYNSDGSRASMCGNGARCIAMFAYWSGTAPIDMRFTADAGLYRAQIQSNSVKLFMRQPHSMKLHRSMKIQGKKIKLHSINTGVPHAVCFVKDNKKINIDLIGRPIRYNKIFKPQGTNVNFVSKKNAHTINVRTYERGVEAETSACGTGVTASAVIAVRLGLVKSPVQCITAGGDVLIVSCGVNQIYLEGPVRICFEGEVLI
ncbi:MAG: diaminopimelate epimerase [bacterium]